MAHPDVRDPDEGDSLPQRLLSYGGQHPEDRRLGVGMGGVVQRCDLILDIAGNPRWLGSVARSAMKTALAPPGSHPAAHIFG